MRFESRRGQNEKIIVLEFQKNIFSLQLFCGWFLGFAFQR